MSNTQENDIILQLYTRSPAPCRDYCGLTVTFNEVILNIWRVTFGPHVYPRRHRYVLSDFLEDKRAQSEIENLFGHEVRKYVTSIAKNEVNLQNLPTKVFHYLLNYLAARDILRLSQTSKILFERCNSSSTVWKMLFKKRLGRKIDSRDVTLAKQYGWKEYLKTKLFIQPRSKNSVTPLNNTVKSNIKMEKAVPRQIRNELKSKPVKSNLGVAVSTTMIVPPTKVATSSGVNLKVIKSRSTSVILNKK